MTSTIDAIKAKVDVVDEIALVVALRKSGKTFKGLCPFHNERTPSFYVFPESQTWRCFGCNEGGDIFTFVQKQQNLEFRDALQYLAEKAGVVLEESESRAEDREVSVAKERLRKMNEEALIWFHHMLLRSKEASGARAYVQSRGISSDSVMAFGIGYAPDHRDTLTRYLLNQGYTEYEIVTGGLARRRDGGEHPDQAGGTYDYFRNRLIFPIRDIRGRVIAFGGRALGDGKPKYLNSPQTYLFEKSSALYAIDMARDAIKQAGQVVIVEGYVDAVIAHQYGTRQTVACIGSAITEKHIQQLKKLTKQVTLALDPDAAGNAATEQGIQEALKTFDRTYVPVPLASTTKKPLGRNSKQPRGMIHLEEQVDAVINVLQLPPGEDPDEVIRRDLSTWRYAVAHPLALIDYYFVVKTADLNVKEPTGKTEAARRLLPVIGMIRDRIKRDAYIRKLAAMISIDERSLYEELQRTMRGQHTGIVTARFTDSSPHTRERSSGQRGVRSATPVVDESILDDISDESQMSVPGPEGQLATRTNVKKVVSGLDKGRNDRIQWEDYLIGLLFVYPALYYHVCGIINDGDFAGTDTRELYRILNSKYQRDPSPSYQSYEQDVPDALLPTIARAQKSIESRSPKDDQGLVREAIQCATRLKRLRLLQLNTELRYLMNEAATMGDSTALRQLQQQLVAIHQQLRTIDSSGMHLQG